MPFRFRNFGKAIAFGYVAMTALNDGQGRADENLRHESTQGSKQNTVVAGYANAVGFPSVPVGMTTSHKANHIQTVSCETNVCESACAPSCAPVAECELPWWAHRTGGFGEFLYLSPGNTDIIYAREETDPGLTGSPTGPQGIVNIDASPGYRAGLFVALDDCSSVVTSYTRWDGTSSDRIVRTGVNILNPVLLHPSTLTAGSTATEATATQSINFQYADLAYRRVLRHGNRYAINWTGGLRYGNLEQSFNSQQTVSVATGLTTLTTDIDFDGFGLLAGLDGERQSLETGLLIYGRGTSSFLGGEWKADASQRNQFGGGVIGNSLTDFRVTPILEAELGTGWQSAGGNVRLTAGVMASGWFNAISTRDYLQSFNESNFVDMNDTISFVGLTSRLELRR